MEKRNLYIILGAIAFVFVVVAIAIFVYFRNLETPVNDLPTPLASANVSQNANTNSDLFTNEADSQAVDQNNASVNANIICAWINNPSGQGIDSDNDALPDNIEKIYNTNPINPDTDGDRHKDGSEVLNGYDPIVAGSARLDRNNNGIFDNQECNQNTAGLSGTLTGGVVSTPVATANPVAAVATPTTTWLDTTLPTVSTSDIHISSSNTALDRKNYLAAVKNKRPKELADKGYFVNALVQAFAGKTAPIINLRTIISNYNKALLAISVPPFAVDYHKQIISMNLFLNDRLGVIQNNAKTDPQVAMRAAQELRAGLPAAISNFNELQGKLLSTANP